MCARAFGRLLPSDKTLPKVPRKVGMWKYQNLGPVIALSQIQGTIIIVIHGRKIEKKKKKSAVVVPSSYR